MPEKFDELPETIRGVPTGFTLSHDGSSFVELIPVSQDGKIISYYLLVNSGKTRAEVNLSPDKLLAFAGCIYAALKKA